MFFSESPSLCLFVLALMISGVFIASLMLPGVWLVVAGGLALELLGGGGPDLARVAILVAVPALAEAAYRFRPKRWRGSPRGDRAIGIGAAAGATVLGVVGLILPVWAMLTASLLGGLAGAGITEFRRRRETLADDDEEQVFAPTRIARRVACVWLRVAVAVGLALWTCHHVVASAAH